MATATSRLQIQIDAKNNASGQIKQVSNDLKGLDNAAGLVAGGLSGLAGAAGVGGLLSLGEAAVGAAYDMARLAATAGDVETSFNTLASAGGASATDMMEALREASRGAISDYELMLTANRAMVLGVTSNTQDMMQLMDVARARSQAMGTTTADAFNDLITGIARLSPMLLDNLGLAIDAEAAYEAYGESVGKAGDKLSDQEKKQAIINEALRQSADLVKANADAGDDLASNFERYEAAVTNAKIALGEAFGGPAAIGLAIMTGYIQNQIALLEGEKDAAEGLIVALKNWATGSNEVTSKTLEMAEAAGKADDVTRRLTFGLPALGAAAQQAAAGMSAAELEAANFTRTLAGLAAQSDATISALDGIASSAAGAIHSAASAAVGIMNASDIARIYTENTKNIDAQVKAMEAVGMTTEEIDFRTQEYAKKASLPFDLAVEAAREAEKANKAVGSSVESLSAEYSNLQSKVQGVLSGALDPGVGVDPADLLPRPDAINEDARRLADVAVNGWASPWAEYFKNEFPDLFAQMTEGNDIKTAAAQMLQDFQDGLEPQLINKEAAKERVRRMLIGDANMAQLANEIATELAAEMGIPIQQALAATQGTLGTGSGAGTQAATTFSDAAAAGLEDTNGGGAFVDKFIEQMRSRYSLLQTAGRDAGRIWGTEFLSVVGDSVPTALIDLLTQLVTPGVLSRINQQGTLTNAVP